MLDQNQIAAAVAKLNNPNAWAFIKAAVSRNGYSGKSASALVAEIWEIVRMGRSRTRSIQPPTCFGIYRSPQHDAEACCEDCPFDNACRKIAS